MNIDNFKNISDSMIWKPAAIKQIETFKDLAQSLQAEIEVVSSHTSKSIRLPVIKLAINGIAFYLRDNFYDYNLCVISPKPMEVSVAQVLEGIQQPLTWEWYLNEIHRCRTYTWDYFTDEEMDNPGVLHVYKLHKHAKPGDKPMDWSVTRDQKNRWLKRMTSPEWWENDWSHGKLCWEGEFGPGVKIYHQDYPFMQGIEDVVPHDAAKPYEKGCTMFALALNEIGQVEALIRRLSA